MTQPQNTDFVVLRPGLANDSAMTILKREAVAEVLKNHPEYVFTETRNGHDYYELQKETL